MTTESTTPYAIALLRVTNGVGLLAHGALLKLGTFGLAGTMGFFGSIGLPPMLGAAIAIAETVAGLLLLAGVAVRGASLAMVPIMLGAAWFHSGNGWVFSGVGGGWEFPAFWTFVLLAQAGLGAGAFAAVPLRAARQATAAA